jgi:hypothetical protein
MAIVSPEEDKELQNNIERKTIPISAWQFAGIRLNTEALDKWVQVELDKAATLKAREKRMAEWSALDDAGVF